MTSTEQTSTILAALKLALPYVESIASRAPTQPANVLKRNQAEKDLRAIRAAIASFEAA